MSVAQMIADRKQQIRWDSERWFAESMVRAFGPDKWEDFRDGKIRHDLFCEMTPHALVPSPPNEELYRPVDRNDPEIKELGRSLRREGQLEDIVLSADGYILSGHRRREGAIVEGLEFVRVRVRFDVSYAADRDRFLTILREYNRQRVKTFEELAREEVLTLNPDEAYRRLKSYRVKKATITADTLDLGDRKKRPKVSTCRKEFADAVIKAVNELRPYWPTTDRTVHYRLLNDPPMIKTTGKGERYGNNDSSYSKLTGILTTLRFAGKIPFDAIDDPTRPITNWNVHQSPQPFIREQLAGFLQGYYRDLQQSQPCHFEIVFEKNTIVPILRRVAAEYCIPYTSGRGFCSVPPRKAMSDRFTRSGKEKLVILVVSDFDPEGEQIPVSFGRSMRDDFGVRNIETIKAALNADQAREWNLPGDFSAKKTSTNYKNFFRKHGSDDVYELEAVPPEQLETAFRKTILSVLDITAYNAEVEAEKGDAAKIESFRKAMNRILQNTDVDF